MTSEEGLRFVVGWTEPSIEVVHTAQRIEKSEVENWACPYPDNPSAAVKCHVNKQSATTSNYQLSAIRLHIFSLFTLNRNCHMYRSRSIIDVFHSPRVNTAGWFD